MVSLTLPLSMSGCQIVRENFWLASCLPSTLVWQLPSSVVPMCQIFADVSRRQTVSTFCRSHTVNTNCERWLRAIVPLKRRDPHHDHKVPVGFESCRELPSRAARLAELHAKWCAHRG